MIARILFVCAQNVCRSPLMADSFGRALDDAWFLDAHEGEWDIISGGTHARPGADACSTVVALAPGVEGHRSSAVSRSDVDEADLVVVASRTERSWIAQLEPSARPRTFTLREALMLDERVGDVPIRDAESFREYVDALDAQRGTIDVSRRRPVLWRRRPEHPLDVIDVHRLGAKAHRRGLEVASVDAARLGRSIKRRLVSA
ncbi:hypothetical protein [Microbacterium sp.]|uniref:arsenate reductase/protein-tyrosine-phosphatase family protein n=1 Tax=Microbacterium sp. TaxID=51671 RepID=UPI003C75C5F6